MYYYINSLGGCNAGIAQRLPDDVVQDLVSGSSVWHLFAYHRTEALCIHWSQYY